jgi:hypothetical protein
MQGTLARHAVGATRPAAATLPRASRPTLPSRVGRTDGVSVRALAPMETVKLASQVATSLSLAVGAWYFYNQEMMLEQVRSAAGPCTRLHPPATRIARCEHALTPPAPCAPPPAAGPLQEQLAGALPALRRHRL